MNNSTKEISSAEKEKINELEQRTILTKFESTVQVLREKYTHSEIADMLGKSNSNVSSTASNINNKLRKAEQTLRLIDQIPSLVRSADDPLSDEWLGLDWTDWVGFKSLLQLDSNPLPNKPGVYRVRHPAVPGLAYVGNNSRRLGRRVYTLAKMTHRDTGMENSPHYRAEPMRKLRQAYDPDEEDQFEVSAASPSFAVRSYISRGIQDALIASYRRKRGGSPQFNFHDFNGLPIKGPPATRTIKWRQWQATRDSDWMGLLWSDPVSFAELNTAEIPEQGIYRVWHPSEADKDNAAQPLDYIGNSGELPMKLQSRSAQIEDSAVFSTLQLQFGYTIRRELQTDFLGAHYFAHDTPPHSQYGDR